MFDSTSDFFANGTGEAVQRGMASSKVSSPLDGLFPVMRQLDAWLERAVAIAHGADRPRESNDPYRGFYIDPLDVEQLLLRQPGNPLFAGPIESTLTLPSAAVPPDSRMDWLRQSFALSDLDIDIIAIALAPEFDLRYEGLYAYLQNDVTRKRPSVDLALNLLCPDAAAKLAARVHFRSQAPLMQKGLLELNHEPHQVNFSSLNMAMKLGDSFSRFLLGVPGLDPQLTGCCELQCPQTGFIDIFVSAKVKQGLKALAQQVRSDARSAPLYLQGEAGLGQRQIAEAFAADLGKALLVADFRRVIWDKIDPRQILRRIANTALLNQAVLFVEGWDALRAKEQSAADKKPDKISGAEAMNILSDGPVMTLFAGEQPSHLQCRNRSDIIAIPLRLPDYAHRRACWQKRLASANIPLSDTDLDSLADRFSLTQDQIDQAISSAQSGARWKTACAASLEGESGGTENSNRDPGTSISSLPPACPQSADLFAAARARSGHDLAGLSRKVEPRQDWPNLVLPLEPLTQLKELCTQAKFRHVVHDEWGFGPKLSTGKGLTVLFSGPPGTGKTMAAEIIAKDLQLDLYKIDLAQIVSKYIGETEKNLNRVFTAAEHANAILLFDEADAIFGKRSEVKDAHDRYANLEVAYLLQKMDEYEGISILTSNLRQNLDEAFTRRINFIVDFPFPEEASRRMIWQGIWPSQTPLAAGVDLELLAKQLKLSGGSIRNIALAAAFLAAEQGSEVQTKHLLHAARREFKKMGRLVDEKEFLSFSAASEKDAGPENGTVVDRPQNRKRNNPSKSHRSR